MKSPAFLLPLLLLALTAWASSFSGCQTQQPSAAFVPQIPQTWDETALAGWTLPLVNPSATAKHISTNYYYGMKVRPIYKSYPIYAPGKEPPGYWAQLTNTEPQVIWDAAKLRTREDWERAGELVFDAPLASDGPLAFLTSGDVRNPDWYQRVGVRVDKDGRMPYANYVIREKGRVEVGTFSCASCHTRIMPDGAVLKGAQGDFPLNRTFAYLGQMLAANAPDPAPIAPFIRGIWRPLFGAPWISTNSDPVIPVDRMSLEELIAMDRSIPPGVIVRHGTSYGAPTQVPDLIGIEGRRYLDKTGLQLHRNIGDLMRYAAGNQDADMMASYDGFIPNEVFGKLPTDSSTIAQGRHSDEQLYALAL